MQQRIGLKSRLLGWVATVCRHIAAVAISILIFPALGLSGPLAQSLRAGVWFAVMGLARGVSPRRGVLTWQHGVVP